MKRRSALMLFSFFFINLFSLLSRPLASSADGFSANPYELSFRDLVAGLHERGLISTVNTTSAEAFWSEVSAIDVRSALDNFFGQSGGVVTPAGLFSAADVHAISLAGDQFSVIVGTAGRHFFSKRPGYAGCVVETSRPSDQRVEDWVGRNMECVFANAVRQHSEDHPVDMVGVQAAVAEYLSSQVSLGIISEFQVTIAAESGGLQVSFQSADGGGNQRTWNSMLVTSSVVNPNTVDEVQRFRSGLDESFSNDQLVVLSDAPAQGALVTLVRSQLNLAIAELRNAAATASWQTKRDLFLLGFGTVISKAARDGVRPATATQQTSSPSFLSQVLEFISPVSIAYADDPVMTPRNLLVAAVRGFKNGSTSEWQPIIDTLPRLGYFNYPADFNSPVAADDTGLPTPPIASLLDKMRYSDTLILDGHGVQSGGFDLMCVKPSNPTVPMGSGSWSCCRSLWGVGAALGLFDPASKSVAAHCGQQDLINPLAFPTSDVSGGLISYNHPSCGGCVIQTAYPFYSKLPAKSAVFTSQCYGGLMVSAPGVSTRVRDFIAGSRGLVSATDLRGASAMRCDATQMAKDIRGLSQYCYNGLFPFSEAGTDSLELWDSWWMCNWPTADQESFFTRGLQTSVLMRGSIDNVNSSVSCNWAPPTNPGTGFNKYNIITLGGKPDVSVEFTPEVAEEDWDGMNYYARFSSPVKTDPWDMPSVNIDSSCRRTEMEPWRLYETPIESPFGGEPMIVNHPVMTRNDFKFTLTGYQMMDAGTWGMTQDDFRKRYGITQTNWAQYVEVIMQLRGEDNAVLMIGNQGGHFSARP